MYAVWSRQDAGAQWRSKAGGRENAGTVVPRVSPAGRQVQAMEDVRIRYSTGPREGAGVVQGMAEEELGRTEQGVGERPGKPRAVLGRRVEPYRKDVEGFKEILDSKRNNAEEGETVKKCIENMVRKKTQGENNAQDEVVKIDGTDYEYVKMDKEGFYQNSVNVWVKRKMYEHPERSNEYAGRVLNVRLWRIEKNRKWIKKGSGKIRNVGFGSGSVKLLGTDGKGQFRLVGLETLAKGSDGVFEGETEKHCYPKRKKAGHENEQGKREIAFHGLKKSSFVDGQEDVYRKAFQNKAGISSPNFIAYVVNHKKTEPLLCTVQTEEKQEVSVFKDEIAPTVLTQEMEQLDEAGYRFATISEGGTVKKVIAMPKGADKDFQKHSPQTAPQPTPSGTPEGGAM